jgi:cysteinyl-tRNA synthetase
MLKIYSTLSRKKEEFRPLEPKRVRLYVCGVTVYDRCHLGHARSMVGFDVMVRFLRASGYEVKFVRNITDIDDKIIQRAALQQIPMDDLTERYIQAMHDDARALNLIEPDIEPRATGHVAHMIQFIQRLMDQGFAYVSGAQDVCFEVKKFADYGKLSQQNPDNLLSGVRIDVAEGKRSPLDFVLWKRAKSGEPSWPSPWGEGRPGWHIECSTMCQHELGDQIDIHGGGLDLQFPHHENEIAQSEAATGQAFARYWMHVGLLKINDEKMAKSLGNFLTIEDVLKQVPAEVLRYFFISSHYRSGLNYSTDALQQAHKSLQRLYQSLKPFTHLSAEPLEQVWVDAFFEAMNDDFNTPEALSVLFDLSHALNREGTHEQAATLKHLGSILGILQDSPEAFLQKTSGSLSKKDIEDYIQQRNQARQAKDWARSDALRDDLLRQGIVLEDGATGTTWRYEGPWTS